MKVIYDILTKKSIKIERWAARKTAKELGFDASALYKFGNAVHIAHRYILPENKSKIFTLIDYDTGSEYDCISNSTLGLYFGKKLSENEIKYIQALKSGRQNYVTIFGMLFYIKGANPSPTGAVKSKSIKYQELKIKRKLNRKILSRLRGRIRTATSGKKSARTEKLVGCKIEFLMGYLEAKFNKNMSWDNYGEWHIDHIIPCSKFDLSTFENQCKCFHYSNLQPLWAKDNLSKNDSIIYPAYTYGGEFFIYKEDKSQEYQNLISLPFV